MAAVPVVLELRPHPAPTETEPVEVTVVDMDDFAEGNKCSRSAGDDQPY